MSKRKEETTQELLGIKELLEYGVRTYRKEELAYFLIQPSNLSVLSEESLSARIYGLMTVLKGITEIEMMCLNSRENFEDNKRYLKERMEEETNPRTLSSSYDFFFTLSLLHIFPECFQRFLGTHIRFW